MNNRVWIELEHPAKDDGKVAKGRTAAGIVEIAEARAKAMSAMLKRLGADYGTHDAVFWSDRSGRYCFTRDSAGGFVEASDCGQWYNLDYLAGSD